MSKIKKDKHNKRFFTIVWLVTLCLISTLLARYTLTGINDMLAVGKDSKPVQITIPENASAGDVAVILKENDLINEEEFFKLYAWITKSGKKFVAGSYELNTSMDYQTILNHIRNKTNAKDILEITITEGMNILECSELLEKNNICSKEQFLKLCRSNNFDEDYTFLKEITNSSAREYKLEGYLFPDTYNFYKGENAGSVISKMLTNYQNKIYKKSDAENSDSKVSVKELAEKHGMTVNDVLIIASLIQAEAANKDDMYNVSSVIHNRLATTSTGGKNKFGEFSIDVLRLDSTVYYPYRTKNNIPKDIASKFVGKYNTYKLKGLPPGPICNPGMDALLAAINPAKTDYYYYCHSKTGEAFYAKDNSTHQANLRKAGLA